MFTGIVERTGQIVAVERAEKSAKIKIKVGSQIMESANLGDSISVSGACLTVVAKTETSFTADVMPETLARTKLGDLKVGDSVNIERAVKVGDRLGGHIVTGHVDAIGTVASIEPGEAWNTVTIDVSEKLAKFLAPQGSITVDGVSLTISDAEGSRFTVALIPETLKSTTLGALKVGDKVNIETDMLAKYVARLMNADEIDPRNKSEDDSI